MLLRNRRDSTLQMQVADSVRYREAVSRLKRILYNRPSSFEYSRSVSPVKERKMFTEALHNKEEYEKDLPDKSTEDTQKSFSSLFDMIKKQDDLIAQLEKENIFLKTELVSTAEASKEIALQNESFRKRLTDTLLQMETSPDLSSLSEGNEKTEEIIICLKDERERLVQCIKLQEETISTLRLRETEAIDKVKQAVGLAEDSQRLTDKVRESGDHNRKDLQHQLEDAFDKMQILQQQLHKAQEREKACERLLRDHEKSLSRLEEDTRDKDLSLKKRELDYQNQIEDLKRNLKEAEEGNERLEKVLQEQRNTSEATFKRLEALLDRRNMETESYTQRRKSLEKQVTDLKQENQRLVQAINDLAKERSYNTDDAKYATQISNALPSVDINTNYEINEIKEKVHEHQNSIFQLQEEVNAVRHEMTQGMEGLRNNLGELLSTIYKEEDSNPNVPISPSIPTALDGIESKVSPRAEIIPDSSHSEGYDTMTEYSRPDSNPRSVQNEQYIPLEEKGTTTKILTIPFSKERKIENRKQEVDLQEKPVDDTEEDISMPLDDIKKEYYSHEDLNNHIGNTLPESNTYSPVNVNGNNKFNTDYELGEDENLQHQIDCENIVNNREISKKEIKANSEEEKEKDESIEDSQKKYGNPERKIDDDNSNNDEDNLKRRFVEELDKKDVNHITSSNEDVIDKVEDEEITRDPNDRNIVQEDAEAKLFTSSGVIDAQINENNTKEYAEDVNDSENTSVTVLKDDKKLEDVKSDDERPEHAKPGDEKLEDVNVKPDDERPEDAKPGDEKLEDVIVKPDDERPEDVKPGDEELKDVKPDDEMPEDVKPGDEKPDDVKSDNEKPDGVKQDKEMPDDVKSENQKPDDEKPENERSNDNIFDEEKPPDEKLDETLIDSKSDCKILASENQEEKIVKMKNIEDENLEKINIESDLENQTKDKADLDEEETVPNQVSEYEFKEEVNKLEENSELQTKELTDLPKEDQESQDIENSLKKDLTASENSDDKVDGNGDEGGTDGEQVQ